MTWLEQIGLLVVTASITTLVTIFIKEKFSPSSTEKSEALCNFHALMESKMNENLIKVDEFKKDIKQMVEAYYSLDKKIEVFIAKDEERLRIFQETMDILKALMNKILPGKGEKQHADFHR